MKKIAGYIVLKDGEPLSTGGTYRTTVKVYRTKSVASRIANRYGGTVHEAFIEIEQEPSE